MTPDELQKQMCVKGQLKPEEGGYAITSIETLTARAKAGDKNAEKALRMRSSLEKK